VSEHEFRLQVRTPGERSLEDTQAALEAALTRSQVDLTLGERVPRGSWIRTVPAEVELTPVTRHAVVADVHLIFRRGDEILLGERQNTGFGDGLFHLPAGHLDPEETLLEAAVREAREELSVELSESEIRFVHLMHNLQAAPRISTFFEVAGFDGTVSIAEPSKCARLEWFNLDDLPEQMLPYCGSALRSYAAGEPFSVFTPFALPA
jgi:8-oxo-dGTP pyrophosphatase MutT (NUDIX family)